MLNLGNRFFASSGAIYPGGPSTWYVIDWDQRRHIAVTLDEELETEDLAFEHLAKQIDDLSPDVYEIHVSPQGDIISSFNDPNKDQTRCVYYPLLDTIQYPQHIHTILRSNLDELDRFGPNVDLVMQTGQPGNKLVFKYYFIIQNVFMSWHEMNLWMRLPKHSNIVPFNGMVLDEIENRCVGFTTRYIPGGTLEENKTRTFKLKWLHQLTNVVDELNLNLGISHQDVAPRNLLIDHETDSLMLFDFNFSARIGKEDEYLASRDDVKGVLFTMYEIITRNHKLRAFRHDEQDVSVIEKDDWIKHPDVSLDHPVSEFREALRQWCDKRRTGKQITVYTDAPNFIDWSPIPEPPREAKPAGENVASQSRPIYEWSKQKLLKQGKKVLNWQRPPQRKLESGRRILETGEYV